MVDDFEQIKAERRQDSADLAWHSTAAGQAHCDATPTDHVSCRVRFSGHWPWRRSGQSAIHESAGYCRFSILLLPVASATCRPTISYGGRFEIIGTSVIHCRLDYCNALLAGIADTKVKRLQSVQNAAAWLVSGARRRYYITPVLCSLHWLPVRRRIIFKTAVCVWKCRPIHGVALPICSSKLYLYQWSVSQVVLVYGLHRLDLWSCRECSRQPASGASASTVPQCGTVCRLLCATTVSHRTLGILLKTYLFEQ